MSLRSTIAFAIVYLICSSICKDAGAQSGTLDNTFGGDGIFMYSIPGYSSTTATGIELQQDGKYVVSGKASSQVPDISKFLAVRVNTDGTRDSSFGIDGYSANNTYGRSFAHDLGLQQDGKILLTGQDFDNVAVTENIGVMRLNTDGSLDTSFADSGRLDIDHGHTEEGHTIIQLANGKIVLTGHTDYDNKSGTIDGPTKNNIFIARLNADGTNDASFGVNGFATFDFGHTSDYSKNMILQGDKYIAGSCTFSDAVSKSALIRVTSTGLLDSSFGTDGLARSLVGIESIFWRMATQTDGKIIAVGQAIYTEPDYDLFVQRFSHDGKIDSSFGIDGTFSLDLGHPAEKFEDVAIQSDGKIVCAGYTSTATNNQSIGDAVVVRLNQDGTLDSTFGTKGVFQLSIVDGFDETKACLIDNEGRIVVAGYAHNQGDGGGSIFIFRLNSGCTTNTIVASGSTTICKAESVTLTVSPPATTYQWKKNGTDINGATSVSYGAKVAGNYTCTVSGLCGTTTTNTISVIVNPKPKAVIKPTGTVQICQNDSTQLKANNTPGLTYQWFKSSALITGATNPFYWAKQGGKYHVVTTDANGCSSQSSKTTVQIGCRLASTNDMEELVVYPNPASSKMYVRPTDEFVDEITIRIFDVAGKLAESKKVAASTEEIEIDVSALMPGLYFLEIESGGIIHRRPIAIGR